MTQPEVDEFATLCDLNSILAAWILRDPTNAPIPDKINTYYKLCNLIADATTMHNVDQTMLYLKRLNPEWSVYTMRKILEKLSEG